MSERQVLICNAGSTSLKFVLYDMPSENEILQARIERIGDASAPFSLKAGAQSYEREEAAVADFETGIRLFMSAAATAGVTLRPDVIGFKTALADTEGAARRVDETVKAAMQTRLEVSPTHNKPYLDALAALAECFPDVPQVAVSETHFHATIPEARRLYGVPLDWSETYGIKRYGYHGTSHRYISESLRARYPDASHILSCHLGGSGSVSAILHGESVHNSFGFSLQSGVLHSRRSGQVDAFVFPFLLRRGFAAEQIETMLATQAGILGVSGISGDMRDIEEQLDLDPRANLAFEVYLEHLLREIGSAYAVLGGLSDFVFTGGIGENSPLLRAHVIGRLGHFGLRLAEDRNIELPEDGRIDDGGCRIHVIRTNEELIVARETYQCQFS